MPQTKIHNKDLQKAIIQKNNEKELWFFDTALLLNVIYLYVKFEVTSFYTLEVMLQTEIHS